MDPPLRRLLLAQVPADLADWLDYVAVASILAFTWQEGPIVFAWFAVALGLPYVVIGPLAGVAVDRLPLGRVMVIANLGRAAATFAMIWAPDWGALLALVALRSSVDSFFTPAKQAAIQALAEAGARQRANGFSHAINQASKIVAPAAGGALLVVMQPGAVFAVNGCVSLIAALILFGMIGLRRPSVGDDGQKAGFRAEFRAGMREVARKPRLKRVMVLVAGAFFAMFFYDTLIAPLIRDFGFGSAHLGLFMAAVGTGGVLGAVGLARSKEAARPFHSMAAGFLISAGLIAGVGFVHISGQAIAIALLLVGAFGAGVATALSTVPSRTLMQNETEPEQMARVTALSEAANTTALLAAPFLGAAIASATTIGVAFVIGGGLLAALSVLAFRAE